MRRTWVGLSVCLVVGLLASPSMSAERSSLTKHCAGTVAVTHSGAMLVASRIRITATAYTVPLHSVRPAVGCRRARAVLHRFLLAKLTRPRRLCTGRVLKGGGCKVGGWQCYENAFVSPPPPGSYDELCTHLLVGPHHALRRLTHIFFHETDHGHA